MSKASGPSLFRNSPLGLPAWVRLACAVGVLVPFWLAIAWAVAVP